MSWVINFVRLLNLTSVHVWWRFIEIILIILILGIDTDAFTEFLMFQADFTLDHLQFVRNGLIPIWLIISYLLIIIILMIIIVLMNITVLMIIIALVIKIVFVMLIILIAIMIPFMIITLNTFLIKLTNNIFLISSRIVIRSERIRLYLITFIMFDSTLSYIWQI